MNAATMQPPVEQNRCTTSVGQSTTMLPIDPESQTHLPTGEYFADRYTVGMVHND